jgi:AbrB family looped-hinge helix DNA binding protein
MTTEAKIFTAKIISLGRITIPEAIRELLELDDGDYVQVEITSAVKKKIKEES